MSKIFFLCVTTWKYSCVTGTIVCVRISMYIHMFCMCFSFIPQAVSSKITQRLSHTIKFSQRTLGETQWTFFYLIVFKQSCYTNTGKLLPYPGDCKHTVYESNTILLVYSTPLYVICYFKKPNTHSSFRQVLGIGLWFYFPFFFTLTSTRSCWHVSESFCLNTV